MLAGALSPFAPSSGIKVKADLSISIYHVGKWLNRTHFQAPGPINAEIQGRPNEGLAGTSAGSPFLPAGYPGSALRHVWQVPRGTQKLWGRDLASRGESCVAAMRH